MKTALELLVFGSIAILIHAFGFFYAPDPGAEASGQGGDFLVSLAAATPQIEKLVRDWETPPEPEILTPEMDAPTPPKPQTISQPSVTLPSLSAAPVQIQAQPHETKPEILTKAVAKPKPKKPAKKPKLRKKDSSKKTTKKKPSVKGKPRKSQAGQQKQRAVGSGGGAHAGTAGKSKVKTGKKVTAPKALQVWSAQIRNAINRRKRSVRGLTRRAKVMVRISVSANGQLLNYRIAKSSGSTKADRAALQVMNAISKLPKAVRGVSGNKHSFDIPMIYKP